MGKRTANTEFTSRKKLATYISRTDALVLVQIYEGPNGWIKAAKGEFINALRSFGSDRITDYGGDSDSIGANDNGDVCHFVHTI